ncbi:chromate transporter [Flavisolibacter nicotianae]|uniref:chromate transporter n=1 Tax=Flavisolibacter nicotianae TaxID=2364882 RepID=UPI000EAD10BB|nr:chromate transporter [Flavisolibacter nicotianae]
MTTFNKSLQATAEEATYTLKDLVCYFLKLGSLGFGGPVALVGRMHKDLVEEKEWIAEEEYRQGLALAQLAPGPLAAQLAIYLGYVHYRIIGATAAGIAFVLPSFLMVIALGFAYVSFGGLSWMQAVFYGIGAAVIGIISVGSYKLIRKSVGKDWLLWTIFAVLAVFTFLFEKESISLILIGSVIYCFVRTKPTFLFADGFILLPFFLQAGFYHLSHPLQKLFWFFLKAGAFVFGSGLAIVPFLYGGVVKEYHWLSEQEFLDAVAVAMITPGPVVITVGFIGYLIAGFPGASVAALATFLPCYLFTILPAPYFKRHGNHPAVKALVEGITAGAVGAIAGAVLVLAKRQFTDLISPAIALITIFALLYFKKLQEPFIILVAAALGLLIKRF